MTVQTVYVWDKPHNVSVDQQSKSVWMAVGEYKGKQIEVKDSTKGAALKRWREAATYRGR
jgi:hypothetical protein